MKARRFFNPRVGSRLFRSLQKEAEREKATMKGGRFFNPRIASHQFRSLLTFQNPPTSILPFNQLLADLVPNSDPTVFSLFNRITRTQGISSDHCTYEIMIKYCTQTNHLNLAFFFLRRLLKEGLRARAVMFNPILTALCSESRFDEAAAIVINKMPKLACIPSVVTYSTLIDGLCKKGEIAMAVKMLHIMISKGLQPNVATYNTLIYGLCMKDEIHKAEEMLHSLISRGLEPNFWTYYPLMLGAFIRGDIDKAKELKFDVISEWHGPNGGTYNYFIIWLCQKGKIDKAKEMLDNMICRGKEPDVVTYNTLIDRLCKKGEIAKAKEVLHSMISKGLEPNVTDYDTLIDGLCKIDKAN